MPLTPFMWRGSKARMLNVILPNIPTHDHYVEPFLGTGVVFLNKPPAKLNTLNDIDQNIVNLFRVLQDRDKTAKLLRRLRYTPYSRAEYRKACLMLSSGNPLDDISRAWAFFVAQNMGITHTYYKDQKGRDFGYLRKPSDKAARIFISKVRNLIAISDKFRYAQIENEDGLSTMRRYDDPCVFMFVDPPYPSYTVLEKRAPYATGYNDKLHEELIDFAASAKSKIMLASYPNELYDKLIKYGWHRIDKEKVISTAVTTRNVVTKRGNKGIKTRRIESLYINYTPPCNLL